MRLAGILAVIVACLGLLAAVRGAECAQDVPVVESGAADSARADSTEAPQVPDSLSLGEGDTAPVAPDSIETHEPTIRLDRFGILPAPEMLGSGEMLVITANDLRELSSVTPGGALNLGSGASVTARGSYGLPQTLSLRAGRPDEVTYLLDGVPVSDRQLEVFDLNWLPLAGMSEVEVFKGGASSIHGSGAIGGVVNVVPSNPVTEVPLSAVDMWWGGFGSRSINLSLRRALAGGLGVLGAYENVRCGGWVDDSSFKGEKMFGALSTGLGRGRVLDVMAFRYEGDVELPDSCPSSLSPRRGRQSDRRDLLAAMVKGGDRTAYRVSLYRLDVSQRATLGDSSGASDGLLNGIDAAIVRGLGSPAVTSFGIGFKRRELGSSTAGERSSDDIQAFAHREIAWERLRLSGRVGAVKNSDFAVEVAPSLALVVLARDRHTVFARIDRSFAFPSLTNLYRDEADAESDWDPDPEHSIGFEAGTRLERDRWTARLALYWTHVRDIVAWRADEACRRARATDRTADIKGLDAAVDFRLPQWFESSVSLSLARPTDRSGDDLEYKPSRCLAWRLRGEKRLTKHVGTGLTFAGKWTSSMSAGKRFAACSGESDCWGDSSLPGYVSGFVLGHLSIDRARIFVRVTNVFDEEIYPAWGLPRLPSRSYELGFTWELVD